jgi:hypothetical protein
MRADNAARVFAEGRIGLRGFPGKQGISSIGAAAE